MYKEDIMSKCIGCGAILQTKNMEEEGYIKEDNDVKRLCERCFRIRNYGDYKIIFKSNADFEPILKKIGTTNDLVVFVVDLMMMNKDFKSIIQYFNQNILLVFTKRDVLPKSINDQKFIDYAKNLGIPFVDCLVVSSYKNYGLDVLMDKIEYYKTSNQVYIVGYTNAGKSTLINKIIYNYSDLKDTITTSILPSTTLNSVEIPLREDLTFIDTPGLIDSNSFINLADAKLLKKIFPKKEIKPITYQIKEKQTIFVEDILRIDVNNRNNFTFYFSNSLSMKRTFKKKNKLLHLKEHIIRVRPQEDIVISGLGFIRVSNSDVIKLYIRDLVDVYTRKSLI